MDERLTEEERELLLYVDEHRVVRIVSDSTKRVSWSKPRHITIADVHRATNAGLIAVLPPYPGIRSTRFRYVVTPAGRSALQDQNKEQP
jgi:hypothetical protein